jgi:hypothetical protein
MDEDSDSGPKKTRIIGYTKGMKNKFVPSAALGTNGAPASRSHKYQHVGLKIGMKIRIRIKIKSRSELFGQEWTGFTDARCLSVARTGKEVWAATQHGPTS